MTVLHYSFVMCSCMHPETAAHKYLVLLDPGYVFFGILITFPNIFSSPLLCCQSVVQSFVLIFLSWMWGKTWSRQDLVTSPCQGFPAHHDRVSLSSPPPLILCICLGFINSSTFNWCDNSRLQTPTPMQSCDSFISSLSIQISILLTSLFYCLLVSPLSFVSMSIIRSLLSPSLFLCPVYASVI